MEKCYLQYLIITLCRIGIRRSWGLTSRPGGSQREPSKQGHAIDSIFRSRQVDVSKGPDKYVSKRFPKPKAFYALLDKGDRLSPEIPVCIVIVVAQRTLSTGPVR